MGQKTHIAWTDATLNFWSGCTKVSAGCAHCYAETMAKRFAKIGKWGNGAKRQRHASAFKLADKLNKEPWVCDECGESSPKNEGCPKCASAYQHRRRVFSLSLGDWLDEEAPIEWLAEMMDTIRRCPAIDFLLLTKRPENWCSRLRDAYVFLYRLERHSDRNKMIEDWHGGYPPLNVWLGVSVENQQAVDERIPELIKIPAVVRFLSVEPMLEAIDFFRPWQNEVLTSRETMLEKIDWAIFGGESGPGARPCAVDWIRDGMRQCREAGVAPFVKQLGSNPLETPSPVHVADGNARPKTPSLPPLRLRDKKGGDPSEWPADLRVREFPKGRWT